MLYNVVLCEPPLHNKVNQLLCMCVWARSLQSCPTLCNLMDGSPPGSSVHEFSRQEYWSGLPCPPAGDLLNPPMELESPALQADSLPNETPGKPQLYVHIYTGEENGNLFQYSCLKNSLDRGAWWAAVHGVAQSWT